MVTISKSIATLRRLCSLQRIMDVDGMQQCTWVKQVKKYGHCRCWALVSGVFVLLLPDMKR
jgi:hypothetical protein